MAGNNVDYLLRLGADTSEFQKDISNVLAEINKAGKNKINVTAEDQALAKSIKQQLKGIITSLKAGDQVDLSKLVNVQTLASQLKGTNDVIVGLRDSVALLGQSFKAISGFELGTNLENTMQNLNVMVEKLGVSIDKFIGKIDNMDGRISKLESAEKPFKQIEGAINSATSASDTSVKKIESNQSEINKSFDSTSEKAKELSDEMKKVSSDVVSDSASKGIEESAKNAEKMAIARIEKVKGYIKKHLPDADLDTGKFKELIDQYAAPNLTKDDRSSVVKEIQAETAKALRLQKDVLIVDNNKIKAEEEILAVKKEQLAVDEKSLKSEVVKKQTTEPDVELDIVKTDESINEKSKDIVVNDEVVSSSKKVSNAKKDEVAVVKDLKTAIDDANKSAEESVKINNEAVKSSKSKKNENSFTYEEYNEKSSSLKNLSIDSLMKEYESVSDASIKQLSSGIVKFSANVKTAEGTWHKFSATVSKDSSLIEKNITDLNAKRSSSLEKALSFEEGSGEKIKLYNADEVSSLAKETESAINRVLTAANKYKVTVDSFGQVSISEIISKDGTSSVDSFIAKFSSVSDLLEKSKGDAEEFKKYFNSAFDVNSYSVGIDKTNKTISDSMKPLTLGNKEYSFMSKDIKSNLSDSLNAKFEEVTDVSIKKAADGVVKFSSKVKDAEKTWKSLSGTISTSGSMIDTTVKDLTDAQSAKLNKSSQPSVGGVKYDSSQVAALAKETEAAIARLLSSANKYKIIVNSLGEVSISETIDAGGKSSETFVAKFSDVKELIDKSRGSVEEFEKYFKSAFSNNSYSIGVNTKESVDKLQFSFESVSKEVDRFSKKSGKVEQYYKAVNKINEAMAEWGALEKKRTTSGLEVDEIKRLTDLRKNIKEVMSIYSSKNYDVVNQKGMAVPDAPTLNGSNIVQTMKELAEMDAKSAIATSVLDEKNRSLTVTYKEIDGVVKKTTYSYDENINMIRKASVETGMYQSWAAKLGNTIKETIKTFGTLFSTYRIASGITQQFKNGITILKTYDEALTNMSYTMDLSKAKFKELGKFAIDMANDLNISIENSMDIYKIYANMTTTVEEINKTAVPTTYLANLTGQTTEQVSDQIQGIMQQFEMQAEQSEHIVDVLESVSSNVAIDNTKAIETMTSAIAASGQAAYDAGLSYEQLAALSAKMAERTREDGGSIGNAIKTMIVRISKASKLSGADEVDNATLSEASKSLHDVGVEVYNLDGSFRQMDVIITELNEKWDGLTDAQQSNIAYNVAATRQTNKFKSMLSSWTESMALATEATNSQGIALENQEKYEDSYVGMLQSISTGWETFLLSITSSAGIKEFLSFIDEMIGRINNLAEGIGGLKVLFAAISTGAMAMSKIEPVSLSYTEKDGISLMILNKALKQNSEQMQADTGFLKQYAAAVGDASRQQQILTDHQGIASLKAREFAIQTKGTAFSVEAYSLKMKGLQAQLTAATIKTNVLNLALKALSVGITLGLNILAMFLIDQFVKLSDKILPKTIEEIEQMKQESLEAIASLKTAFDELNKSAKGYSEQFAELSQGVNQLTGENVSLSTEDYDTFLSLSNKLADLFPDLTRVYDENGNAIVNLTGDIDSIVLKIDELIQKQRELVNEDIVKEFPNVYDAYRKDRNSYNNVISEEESQKKAIEESLKSLEDAKSNIRKVLSGDVADYDYTDPIQKSMFESLKAELLKKKYSITLQQDTIQKKMFLGETDQLNISGEWSEKDVDFLADKVTNYTQKTQEVVQNAYAETIKELETGKKNLSDAIADMDKVTQAYLVNLDGYQDIVNQYGSEAGISIQSMLKNIDWLDMGIKEKEIMPWIENTIDTINESAPDIAEKITNIFSGVDIPAEELFSNIGDVVSFFVNNGIEIPYTLIEKSDSIKDITERIEAIRGKFIRTAGESGGEVQAKLDELAINELFEEFDIDSAEDYEYFLSVVQGAENATDAVEMYKEAVNASLNLSFIDRDEISSSLDEIQFAYSAVSGAISDYNETGVLSLENVQSLLELDDKYLAMLINENGQLILNTDSYNKLTLAQLENLKVTAIAESIKSIDELVDEESALKRLSQATIEDTDATWDNLTAKVASYKTSLMIERTQGKDVTSRLAAVDQIVQSTEHQIMLVDTAIRDMMTNSSAFYGESANSAKSETDSLVDAFDDAYEKLNVLRDADAISEIEYLERLRALNSEYYKDKEKYAKEFYEYEKEYFEGMIGVYDTVIGAVQDKIDKQIDLLEDQKDSVTSYYESLIDANEKKIESYEAEVDALNAANDARELALSLEDAIWEDRKANEQRPNLTYDNGQFVYDTDRDAQRSAREALEKVRLDIQISEIEKLKETLESANKQLEIALKKETDAIDANIDALERYKDKWGEISSITSDLRNNEMAEQLLGKNWEADILNTRLQNWEDFKNKYIATQKEMAAAAAAYAGNPTTPTASTSSGQTTGSNTSTKKIVGYTVNGKTYASLELATRAQTAIYTAQKSAIERSYLGPYEKALKIKSLLQEIQKKYPIVPVKAYKRGGIVGDDELLNKVGEDQLAALSYGEGVLTPKETDAYVDSAPEIPALVNKLDEFMSNGIPDSWMKFIDAISGFKDNPNFAYENGLIKEAASKVVGDTVNNNEKSIIVQFGDIYVSGVDDANALAREIVNRLPNAVARELGK